ncbi:MAG: hypothetical protein ACJAV6_000373 [Candidatus Paceibacteria bacterium]|jgi:hypothetical protein
MRIIDKIHKKIKEIIKHNLFDEVMWFFIIMFVALGSFSLGMIHERKSYLEQHPITVTYSDEAVALFDEYQSIKHENQNYFASKSGSIVYPLGCSKGERVKEENRVFFQDLGQALGRGYREAEGC